jgi:antitoxin MazE
MEANVIKVGNSKGIIIPAKFLRVLGITESVEINMQNNKLILSAVSYLPRKDWEESFKTMHEKGDDLILIEDDLNDSNLSEWTW